MINNVILTGRLTKDPTVLHSENKTVTAKFTIAVSRNYKTDNENKTDFINVVCFNKTAEVVEKNIKKGMLIGLQGSIITGNYKNKEGKTVYTTEVLCNVVDFLESKADKKEDSQKAQSKTTNELLLQLMDAVAKDNI